MLLPMAACVLLARRFGVTEPVLLVLSGLAGSGLLGFAVFWAYLFNSEFGRACAVAVDLACAVVVTDACRSRFARWREIAELGPVTALYSAASLFYLAIGYLYGGVHNAGDIAEDRFAFQLPGDNYIPMFFAEQLEGRHRPLPNFIMSNFQSSDRPPLQTDYELLQDALLGHSAGHYLHPQIIGTLVQGLWIFGLWALLRAARRPRWVVPLCLAGVLFSGFAMVNSFFVWPKLVAVAGLMAACAVLLVPELKATRASRLAGALTGAALGCSMLAHPGTSFVILALVITLAVFRMLPRLRFLLAAAGGLIVSYLPWMLYQQYYQPPANALLELQLAGEPKSVPGKSTGQAILDAYRQIGLHKALSNKVENFITPFHHTFDFLRNEANLVVHALSSPSRALTNQALADLNWQFFLLLPTLGLIGWGILILAARGVRDLVVRVRANRAARASGSPASRAADVIGVEQLCLIVLAVTYVIWCLIMFDPGTTVIHQGSYFIEVMALTLGVLGWWSLSPRLAAAVVGVTAACTLYLYVRFTPYQVGRGTPFPGAISTSIAAVAVLSGLACLAGLWWIGRQPQADPASTLDADLGAPGAGAEQEPTIPAQTSGSPEIAGAGS